MTNPNANPPTESERDERRQLLMVCQLLLDPTTLRVLGALSQRPQTITELAATTSLEPATVYQRLSQLRELSLVADREQIFRFRHKQLAPLRRALGRLNRSIFHQDQTAPDTDATTNAADQRLINHFVRNGRLTELPTHPEKLLVVLRWLASQFEDDKRYAEREVNAIILRHHEDYATLRRAMIDNLLMARDNGVYWRLPAGAAA